MNGVINIYKEKGFTSHDVVAKLRGILKTKKVGHTGTLDPEAEGVLPVCIGTATRLCDMLTDKVKEYRTVLFFGVSTDTDDMTGAMIKAAPVLADRQALCAVLPKFIGEQNQIPPMYSAIKVDGKKLYELAREGIVIERQARPIVVYDIQLLSVKEDDEGHLIEAELSVVCGKGTYIRSLCRDIGAALDTCACMKSLVRTRSGDCRIEHSLKLSEVEQLRDAGTLSEHIVTVEQIFSACPVFRMKPEWDKLLLNGNQIMEQDCEPSPQKQETVSCPEHEGQAEPESKSGFPKNWYRACDSTGNFLGIYEKNGNKYVPVKMFLSKE